MKALAAAVLIALLAAPVAAAAVGKPQPRMSGVWAVFQIVTASGRRGMADPPMSKQGEATVGAFRSQYNLEGMEPNAYCVEPGMPTVMYGVGNQPIEIIQSANRITILSEVGMQVRRIFMDGRKAPEGYPPTRNGWSTGRWEGDALVIETQLIEAWMMPRWAHTDKARTVERLRLLKAAEVNVGRDRLYDPGAIGDEVLVDELTMYDPDIYDTPPSIKVYYRRLRDDEFIEQACPEGLWLDVMRKLKKPAAQSGVGPQAASTPPSTAKLAPVQ
jgi:hypothetical protein